MNSKERVECVFNREKPDRYPSYEHFWGEAIARWHQEGLPEGINVFDYFEHDMGGLGWFDLSVQNPVELISEDDTYRIIKDSRGVVSKTHKNESGHTPHWLETPIKQPEDWWTYKEKLVFNETRVPAEAPDQCKLLRDKGLYVCAFNADPYEQAWPVFGQVQIFMAMIENPDVVKDAMDTWANLTIDTFEHLFKMGGDIDAGFFYADMGYRNGTLFAPEVYREQVMDSHKKIVNYLHDNGKKAIIHSCGQIKSFIPMLIEVGWDALQPIEAKCDQDVRELQPLYGDDLVFFGNMDVVNLSKSEEDVKEEVSSKLSAFDGKWNYIFHSDHSIPQTVSLSNYQLALKTAREFLK